MCVCNLHTGYSAVISRTTSTVKGVSPISKEQCFGKTSKPLMRLILAKGNGYVNKRSSFNFANLERFAPDEFRTNESACSTLNSKSPAHIKSARGVEHIYFLIPKYSLSKSSSSRGSTLTLKLDSNQVWEHNMLAIKELFTPWVIGVD